MPSNSGSVVKVSFVGDAKQLQQVINQVGQSTDSLGGKLVGMGVGVAKALAVFDLATEGATKLIHAFGGLTAAASDTNESQNKVQVVFGQSAKAVTDFAAKASTSMGLSQKSALEYAGTLGNLLVSMGLTGDKSAEMSTSMLKLAADMASFNNASPEDVLEAIRSGLVGEEEPLRRFGVNLSATAIQAKAVELGLARANGVVSTGAKAQAAYALILEQTKTAQGDFARTSDGLANSQRTTKAVFSDLAAVFGRLTVPATTALTRSLGDLAARLLAFTETDRFTEWAAKIQAACELAIDGIGQLAQGFATTLPAVLRTVETIGKEIYTALQWINPFARHSPSLVDQVNDGVNAILAKYGELPHIGGPLKDAAGAVQAFAAAVSGGLQAAADAQTADAEDALSVWGEDAPRAYAAAVQQIDALSDSLKGLSGEINDQQGVVDGYQEQIDQTQQAIKDEERAIRDAEAGLAPYEQAVQDATDAVNAQEKAIKAAEAALRPYEDAVASAEAAVTAQERAITAAERALRPYEQAVTAAEAAVKEQSRAVKDAEDALKPYDQALQDAEDSLKAQQDVTRDAKTEVDRLTQSYSDAERALKDLSTAQLAGSKAYNEQLFQIQQQSAAIQLQITNLKLGPQNSTTTAQIAALQKQLDALNLSADKVRLQEQLDLGPQQHTLENLADTSKEVTFQEAVAGIQAAKQQMATLTPQIDAANARLAASQQAEEGLTATVKAAQAARDGAQASVDAAQAKLDDLTRAQDAARDSLDKQQASVDAMKDALDPLNDRVDAAKDALDQHRASVDKMKDALDPLNDKLDAARDTYDKQKQAVDDLRKNALQPLQDKLSDLQDSYDKENKKLGDLKQSYNDVSGAIKQYEQFLDSAVKTAQSAKDTTTPGSPAAPKGIAQPDFGPTPGNTVDAGPSDPFGLRAAAAQVDQIKGQIVESLRPIKEAAEGIQGAFDKVNTAVSNLGTTLNTTDWKKAGERVGEIITTALTVTIPNFAGQLRDLVGRVDWVQVGKEATPKILGFVLGLVTALLDPVMWARFIWQNKLDVGLLVATIVFAPSKFIAPIARALEFIPLAGELASWLLRSMNEWGGPARELLARFSGDAVAAFGKGFTDAFGTLGLGDSVGGFFERTLFGPIRSAGETLYLEGLELAGRLGGGLGTGLRAPLDAIGSLLSAAWDGFATAAEAGWGKIADGVLTKVAALGVALGPLWLGIETDTAHAWDAIAKKTGDAWDGIKSDTYDALIFLQRLIGQTWEGIRQTAVSMWDRIEGAVSDAWAGIKQAVDDGLHDVSRFMNDRIPEMVGHFTEMGLEGGHALVKGAIDALKDAWHEIQDWINGQSITLPFIGKIGGGGGAPAPSGGGSSAYGFIKPVAGAFVQGFYGSGTHHAESAIDWAADYGSPVVDPANGVVVNTGFDLDGASGRGIDIVHDNGFETVYGHLSSIAVAVGQRVSQGQLIGTSGSPELDGGAGSGAHLHMAIRYAGDGYVDGTADEYFPLALGGFFRAGQPVLGVIGEGQHDEIASPVPVMQQVVRAAVDEALADLSRPGASEIHNYYFSLPNGLVHAVQGASAEDLGRLSGEIFGKTVEEFVRSAERSRVPAPPTLPGGRR